MPRLGQTVAALKRPRPPTSASATPSGRLRGVEDFGQNPGALRMLVYTPDALPSGSPLVVLLHGCTQTADAYATGAGWLTLADRYGFALVCPEQTRGNNPNLCFNWFQPEDVARGGGEAGSIAAMVRHAVIEYRLDATRVFVTGLSAGGAMTAAMLASHPEMFAGGAMIAGLPYGSANSVAEAFSAMSQTRIISAAEAGGAVRAASRHKGPWPPVSIWQGEADTVVRPAAADALVHQWTDVHGVTGDPVTARTPQGRDFQLWLSAAGDPVVELHRIPGMGHGTPLASRGPEGIGVAGPYMLDVGISSSLEIALGWGIATAEDASHQTSRRREMPPTPDRALAATLRPESAKAPERRSAGVTAVIEQALRAAGLMK